jgi:hypothetical protein
MYALMRSLLLTMVANLPVEMFHRGNLTYKDQCWDFSVFYVDLCSFFHQNLRFFWISFFLVFFSQKHRKTRFIITKIMNLVFFL